MRLVDSRACSLYLFIEVERDGERVILDLGVDSGTDAFGSLFHRLQADAGAVTLLYLTSGDDVQTGGRETSNNGIQNSNLSITSKMLPID